MPMFTDVAKAAETGISQVEHLVFNEGDHWFLAGGRFWRTKKSGDRPVSVGFDNLPDPVKIEVLRYNVSTLSAMSLDKVLFLGHTEMWMECWFQTANTYWKLTITGRNIRYESLKELVPEFALLGAEKNLC